LCFDLIYKFWFDLQILIWSTNFDLIYKFWFDLQILILSTNFDLIYKFWFDLQISTILYQTFLIIRRIRRYIIINEHRSLCKLHVILVIFWSNLNFFKRFWKNPQILIFMKIHLLETDFFMRTDGRTRRHYEANSRFSYNFAYGPKNYREIWMWQVNLNTCLDKRLLFAQISIKLSTKNQQTRLFIVQTVVTNMTAARFGLLINKLSSTVSHNNIQNKTT